ncbi:hypothetical protein BD410DRAFT_871262 [Rickenella mellea]|uniref:Uncharacterized protein n=1 Tax=Rickenella mellea TaxID=50990 RepID=A0A4Y7Q0J6_9AGAM|nr:hypothetical protein BD410DRAFT_871262 [Rickenella mellea]
MSHNARRPNNNTVPFRDFLSLGSFVASIGIALSVSASSTLACSTTFMSRSDDATIASMNHSAILFTWAATVYGLALLLALLVQLLLTSPETVLMIQEGPKLRPHLRTTVAGSAWVSLMLVGAATALVGEGLKVVDRKAGATLEWALLGFGLPLLLLWITLRAGGSQQVEYQGGTNIYNAEVGLDKTNCNQLSGDSKESGTTDPNRYSYMVSQ